MLNKEIIFRLRIGEEGKELTKLFPLSLYHVDQNYLKNSSKKTKDFYIRRVKKKKQLTS